MSKELRDYLSQFTFDPRPVKGALPIEVRIFSVGTLEIRGSQLLFSDSWCVPNDSVVVKVKPSIYEVYLECFSYGTEGRIARLIVQLPKTSPQRGNKQGYIDVDVASAAVCDGDLLESFMNSDEDAWENWLETFTNRDYDARDIAGLFPCPQANTLMFYTETGFGDGSYPVYELVENGLVVGAEVVFLKSGLGYFDYDANECEEV